MPASDTVRHRAGRIAALSRSRKPDDPELVAERQAHAVERLAEHVEKVVAGWPKLTDEQLDRVAALLRAGGAA
jgi:hypothetical protein